MDVSTPPSLQPPIALIGAACRFPGGAHDPHSFWRDVLAPGRDAIGPAPTGRGLDDQVGGFLDRVADFDPLFFHISPRESVHMDPGQRLLLELSWEALEDAGLVPSALAGTRTAVFVGAMWSDYQQLAARHATTSHTGTGQDPSVLAARISYFYDFRGPAIALQTASSSSLAALHLAVQNLRLGECDLALVAGVNLLLTPRSTEIMRAAGTQASGDDRPPRCRAFGAHANGYVRGEGGGVIVLQSLARARAEGRRIYCDIRATATTQDGRTDSLTAPAGDSQEELLRRAYRAAGIAASQVGYVEAHGTGTRLGDPVEAHALASVLGAGRSPDRPLYIGSVKSNIGHLEAAAGIAGVIKTALALAHRQIPASLHGEPGNPQIPFADLGLRVVTEPMPWPHPDQPAIAGVSSFGWGGTNVHAVLSGESSNRYPASADVAAPSVSPTTRSDVLLPISGHTRAALRQRCRQFLDLLTDDSRSYLSDLCDTAGVHRQHLPQRIAIVASDLDEARAQLGHASERAADSASAPMFEGPAPRIAFAFSGSGCDWPDMGAQLAREQPAFADAWQTCRAQVRRFMSAGDARHLDEGTGLQRVSVAQPAIFAVQVALASMWRSFGIRPEAVVGHSLGEVAAAHVAGALELEDAARVICARSRAIQTIAGAGATALLGLDVERARAAIATHGEQVGIAGRNAPDATLISGALEAVRAIVERVAAAGDFARVVAMPFAGHSAQMEPLCQPLARNLEDVAGRATEVRIYSTATGTVIDGARLGATYWPRNLRQPVLFSPVVRTMVADGIDLFLELGPHPVLHGSLRAAIRAVASDENDGRYPSVLATMRRQRGLRVSLESLARMYEYGCDIDFAALAPHRAARLVDLPGYPWQRQRYWIGEPIATESAPSLEVASGSAEGLERGASHALPSELAGALPGARRATLRRHVSRQVCELLGLPTGHRLDGKRSLKEYGLDSMMRMALRRALERTLELRLPASFATDHPTLEHMVQFIDPQMGGVPVAGERRPSERSTTPEASATDRQSSPDRAIAIVGASCRLPGADSLESFWRLVRDGVDAIRPVPAGRWRRRSDDAAAPASLELQAGGFLSQDISQFDARFFGISAREALSMDPQQRLLLEVTWEALADAGVPPESLRHSDTGVFVGISTHEYGQRHIDSGSSERVDAYSLTGNAPSVASGRIAFLLGCQGPSMSVDTACSSGMTALHLARQSLRAGEIDLAIVGAVDLLISPVYADFWGRVQMMSPGHRSRTFDAAADGFAKGEGCVVLVLARQSDADARGMRARASILGGALVNDARTGGLTVPDGASQVRGLRRALADAGIEPAQVSYVQAHGTGGPVADAVEVQALGEVFSRASSKSPILLRSVKANIGHLGASGALAGLLDVVCSLQQQAIGPQVHFQRPSPHIEWSELPYEVPRTLRTWQPGVARIATVTSIGLSGTTGTVVLQEARPPLEAGAPPEHDTPEQRLLLPLSAASDEALTDSAQALADWIESAAGQGASLADIVHTAAARRGHREHRLAIPSASRTSLPAALRAFARGRESGAVIRGRARTSPRVAFVFTGVSAEWPGMGLELLAHEPVFREAFLAFERIYRRYGIDSLSAELERGPASRIHEIEVAQPTVFGLQVALVTWLRHLGITPEVVMGHSLGEVAAACAAGAVSLEQAAEVLYHRGRLLARARGGGRMATIALSARELEGRIADMRARNSAIELTIASISGPRTTVVAGSSEAIGELVSGLTAESVFARELRAEAAYHSPQMDPLLSELHRSLAGTRGQREHTPMISTILGRRIAGTELDGAYWGRNMRDPVLFARGVEVLLASDCDVLLEIGPNPDLRWAMTQCAGDRAIAVVPTLRRDVAGRRALAETLSQLYVHGVTPDFGAMYPGGQLVPLPHYPWQRRRYWMEDEREATRGRATVESDPSSYAASEPASSLGSTEPPVRQQAVASSVHERLRGEVTRTLALDPQQELDDDASLADIGMDSFMGMELAEHLGRAFGVEIPATAVFEHGTVNALAGYLGRLLPPLVERDPADAAPAVEPPLVAERSPGVVADERNALADARFSAEPEPIAIVGMACRLPGGVDGLDAFWQLLETGTDAVAEIPKERFDVDAWFDPELARAGTMYCRTAGLLTGDLADFDADFFGITPREAAAMDPQHRLALEVTWEAVEHAGLTAERLRDSDTGVYLGICSNDYSRHHIDSGRSDAVNAYSRMGIAYSVGAGRIAYFLGTRGPALAIDTACSSSLVALHQACASLRSGETSLGLVVGVNLLLKPEVFASLCHLNVLSRSGRVRAFSADADGYVRGEGCAVLVVERLRDAIAHGHTVHALVRGSASNHNGRSNGIAAPSVEAQTEVISAALADARLRADDIDCVEAHGTGTRLGDAIELQALERVFTPRASDRSPVLVGSLKTQIGHLESAAGVASVIKLVLAMQRARMPGTLHLRQLNPHFAWQRAPLQVAGETSSWPHGRGPQRAGVSSFGANGSNAHVILEAALALPARQSSSHVDWHLLALSAPSEAGVRALAARHGRFLAEQSVHALRDIAYTACLHRTHHKHRLAVVGREPRVMAERLRAFCIGAATAESLCAPVGSAGSLAHRLARIYLTGDVPDWSELFAKGRITALPAYPWQRRRHWLPAVQPADGFSLPETGPESAHPLLQRARSLGVAPRTWVWSVTLDRAVQEYLADHRFRELVVSTGALHLELALAAMQQLRGTTRTRLRDVSLTRAVPVPERGAIELSFMMTEDEDDGYRFQTVRREARGQDPWRLHASGRIALTADDGPLEGPTLESVLSLRGACHRQLTTAGFYAAVGRRGLDFGPAFQAVQHIWWREGDQALARLQAPAVLAGRAAGHVVHPALLDACSHPMLVLLPASIQYIGAGVDDIRLRAPLPLDRVIWTHTRLQRQGDALSADVTVFDRDGALLMSLGGMRFQAVQARDSRRVDPNTPNQNAPAPEAPAATRDPNQGPWTERVAAIVRRVAGFSSHGRLALDREFADLGLDSLMMLELRVALESELGVSVSHHVTADHPTIASLAQALAARAPAMVEGGA